MYIAYAQEDLNLNFLRNFQGTFSLDTAHMRPVQTKFRDHASSLETTVMRWQMQTFAASLPGIIVLQELSLRLSIFHFRLASINSL